MKNYGYSMWYVDGNFMEGRPNVTKDNWKLGVQNVTDSAKNQMKSLVPFDFDITTSQTALDAYKDVLEKTGCRFPVMDPVDNRIINEVTTGTASYGASWGAKTGIIDSQNDVGGWPVLKSSPAPKDSDLDGLPDDWELKHGLNPNDPKDGNKIGKDGYTNLEDYLNSLSQI